MVRSSKPISEKVIATACQRPLRVRPGATLPCASSFARIGRCAETRDRPKLTVACGAQVQGVMLERGAKRLKNRFGQVEPDGYPKTIRFDQGSEFVSRDPDLRA